MSVLSASTREVYIMARKRMIDPEFWLDEELAQLTPSARLLFIGLWSIADDNYATFPNRPEWVKAQIFPYNSMSTRELLDELSNAGKIVPFKADDGKDYYYIKNFFKYQRVDRPSAPKYPQFDENRVVLDESSTSPRPEVKLSKVKLSEEKEKYPLTYLTNIPEEDVIAFSEKYNATKLEVKKLGEKLKLWSESKSDYKKNNRAFLQGRLLEQYGYREKSGVVNAKEFMAQKEQEFTAEEELANQARLNEMKANLTLKVMK